MYVWLKSKPGVCSINRRTALKAPSQPIIKLACSSWVTIFFSLSCAIRPVPIHMCVYTRVPRGSNENVINNLIRIYTAYARRTAATATVHTPHNCKQRAPQSRHWLSSRSLTRKMSTFFCVFCRRQAFCWSWVECSRTFGPLWTMRYEEALNQWPDKSMNYAVSTRSLTIQQDFIQIFTTDRVNALRETNPIIMSVWLN